MKIIGQKKALIYLRQGLDSNRLSPSLLFAGPSGIGKRTVAFELAKSLLCSNKKPSETDLLNCDECLSCQQVDAKTHADVFFLDRQSQADILKEKPEAQTSVKIESIRHLDKFLRLKSMSPNHRVAIVDEAHKMTTEAANALLKILEEPPNHAQIILIADEERRLPSTILSRCAVVHFGLIQRGDITKWLVQHEGLDIDLAEQVTQTAEGSLGKAFNSKDQEIQQTDLASFSLDEFFDQLSAPAWRKEGRQRAQQLISYLIMQSQRKLQQGDMAHQPRIRKLLDAKRQIERYVSPRLVLENLFVTLEPIFKK